MKYQQRRKFLGALLVAVLTVACGPTDTGNGTKPKTSPAPDQSDQGATSDPGPSGHETMGPGMNHEGMNHEGMDQDPKGTPE